MKFLFHFWCKPDLYDRSRRCPIVFSSLSAHCPIGHESSISYYLEITPAWLITLLSCHLFVIYRILSDWSWQFSSDFSVERTYMITHIIILSGLHHRPYLIGLVMIVKFRLGVSRNYTIGQVIVLSCFRHILHMVWSILTV